MSKLLEAKCLCGSVHFQVEVPESVLPLSAYLCHCSICRYSTGAPCIFHTVLPPDAKRTFVAPSSMDNLDSWPVGLQSWKFCSTCGCHITAVSPEGAPGLVRINKQLFTKSAKGGGISEMCSEIRGEEIASWNPPDHSPNAKLVESKQEFGPDGEERLRVECACGGVSFTIRRPDKTVLEDEHWKKYVYPHDKSKWSATFDLCSDCRIANSTHVVGWMLLPRVYCEPEIGPDLKIGTMKTYESSHGVVRSFCGTCSATFFYTCSERSPSADRQVVDLATGVLRAPEGVMAENWLGWRSRVAWQDDGVKYDRDFAEALQVGMKQWVTKEYGTEFDREI
ncbi:hypothetical protein NLU13_8046 [Sarocladium strictum]|uniref:CENP-V/GFA domain-containing protein n=1 Tax=Sarocladium strictum TaxID=5046 RepID=A0AA39L4L5_SARSR|nr:hypothetical protein NLU13_8046 [Sarocladium strictum]